MAKPKYVFADWNVGHSELYFDKEMIQLIQEVTKTNVCVSPILEAIRSPLM